MEKLSEISNDLSALRAAHESFTKELLGNGQPGRIQRIEKSIEKNKASTIENENRIQKISNRMWYFNGIAVGVLGLFEVLKHKLLK